MQLYFAITSRKCWEMWKNLHQLWENVVISLDRKNKLHLHAWIVFNVSSQSSYLSSHRTELDQSNQRCCPASLEVSLSWHDLWRAALRSALGARTARWCVSVLVWQSCATQLRDSSSLYLSRVLVLLLFMKSSAYHWRTTSMSLWPVQASRIWRRTIVSNHSWRAWL